MLVSLFAWLWVYLLFAIEAVWVLIGVTIAFDFPGWGARWFERAERSLSRFAHRRFATVLAVAGVAFLLRGALFTVEPIPEPSLHDEFSYLLQADTFALGRLTNPTHPMWVHFESMHIEHHPSYASMYPPGQGLVLALGKLLGNPFYGVWIMGAVLCGAICWMLQGWLPAGWALFGAAIALIRLATFSYWVDSYMLGALPATAGALVLGATGRILKGKNRFGYAVVLGVGVALLLTSRPYEGAALSATAVGLIVYQLIREKKPRFAAARRVFGALALTIIPALAFQAYYDWRVFGSAFTLPYQVNRATYAVAGVYVWDSPRPMPKYRHKAMADFYTEWELPGFEAVRSARGLIDLSLAKLIRVWQFYLGPALTLPLLILPVVFRDKRMKALLIACGVVAVAVFWEAWFMPHYVAPIACAGIAIGIQAMRHLRLWRWKGRPVGLALVRMVPAVCVLMLGIRIGIAAFQVPMNLTWPFTWATVERKALGRRAIVEELESRPGFHLVIVRYGAQHDPLREYVYNAADIDRARIVWARDMGAAQNRKLVEYFSNRQVWELDADASPPRLQSFRE